MGDSLFWQPATLSFFLLLVALLCLTVCVVLWQIKFLSLSLSKLCRHSQCMPMVNGMLRVVDNNRITQN